MGDSTGELVILLICGEQYVNGNGAAAAPSYVYMLLYHLRPRLHGISMFYLVSSSPSYALCCFVLVKEYDILPRDITCVLYICFSKLTIRLFALPV